MWYDYFVFEQLQNAVAESNLKLTKQLVYHGVDNAIKHSSGDSLLVACGTKLHEDLKIVKELLMNDGIYCYNFARELPLDMSLTNKAYVKLFIKINLLKTFKDCTKSINLRDYPHLNCTGVDEYYKDCIKELNKMEMVQIGRITLTTLCAKQVRQLTLSKRKRNTILWLFSVYKTTFPIYYDIIIESLKNSLQRINSACLLNMFDELQIYAVQHPSELFTNCARKIILNYDCLLELTKYLNKNDMLNFLIAYCIDMGVVANEEVKFRKHFTVNSKILP